MCLCMCYVFVMWLQKCEKNIYIILHLNILCYILYLKYKNYFSHLNILYILNMYTHTHVLAWRFDGSISKYLLGGMMQAYDHKI